MVFWMILWFLVIILQMFAIDILLYWYFLIHIHLTTLIQSP